jgi:hypothetical protein
MGKKTKIKKIYELRKNKISGKGRKNQKFDI